MPYVDHGEPRPPMKLPPILPVVAALVLAAVGTLSWIGCFKWFGMSYPGGFLTGLFVGMGLRFTLRQPMPKLRIAVIPLTVVACIAGYVWVFYLYYTNFSVSASLGRYFHDIMALIVTGFGGYLAFVLSYPAAPRTPSE